MASAYIRWFMCSGILFVGLLVALWEGHLKLGVPLSVVLGGALWALSNFEACLTSHMVPCARLCCPW